MKIEISNPAIAQYEMLISYMKIFLITASRIKSEQLTVSIEKDTKTPEILQRLKMAIEDNFNQNIYPSSIHLC